MARVTISEPAHYPFSMETTVTINLINRADHLGNDSLVALLNEARLQFMAFLGLPKLSDSPENFINADLAVSYRAEAHHGDQLQISVGVGEVNRYGCDFVYRVTRLSSGVPSGSDTAGSGEQQTIAIAKTAMLMFDYDQGKVAEPDQRFWQCLYKAQPELEQG